ncbi:hypothetical protein K435DRAFT_690953 [Dendrothele bispora CBS 962.96]|uniref:Uncharacterized protein n=1 Tax=Dendrothele bispora (strain CBS 962.96) TaxID=1314807 RepID=A0A4S8L2N7_DENBC|nr:hypothetical protein K435DRAFT_690953 [Dendrothele bispora CBS 962.96]
MIRALKARCARIPERLERARQSLPHLSRLKHKRTYTPQIRALAHQLARFGCARSKIGTIIKNTAALFGVQLKGTMSRRTVGRAILEGWVAAQVQLGYEMSKTPCIQDSTGHKHQNIEAQHAALRVADYTSGQTDVSIKQTPTTRVLSIRPTLDHTAEQSKLGWLKNFATIIGYYIRSPLFQREGLSLTLQLIARKIKGMNGDQGTSGPTTKTTCSGSAT